MYLDTVFLLGGVAATHGDARWWFALGAMVASVIWFTGLAYGARWAGRWLARPGAWRVLDAIIAVVMIGLESRSCSGCKPPRPGRGDVSPRGGDASVPPS